MFFKALCAYRLDRVWLDALPALQPILQARPLPEITAAAIEARGWNPLVRSAADAELMTLVRDYRNLPAAAVRRLVAERIAEHRAQQGFVPGRKQLRDIKDEIIVRLTPSVPVQRAEYQAVLDRKHGWLLVNSSTPARADDVTRSLRQALESLPASPLQAAGLSSLLTLWLANGAAPAPFSFDDECQLVARDDKKSTVRYAHHDLSDDNVVRHLRNGKLVSRVALTWRDRVSFVLDEHMCIRKLKFLDDIQIAENRADCDSDQAEIADLTLMMGSIRELLADLCAVTGAELPERNAA